MRESNLQRKCLAWVKEERPDLLAVNIHVGGYNNKGFPDTIIFGRDKAVVAELKAGNGYKLQPDQKVWRGRFQRVGIPHAVPESIDEFKGFIRKEFPGHEG